MSDYVYRITEWNERYEPKEREGRTKKPLPYVKLKAVGRDHSTGYRRLLRAAGTERVMICFGVFCKLLEIAASETRENRGYILDEHGKPADEEEIAFLLGIPDEQVIEALEILCKVGWIEKVSISDCRVRNADLREPREAQGHCKVQVQSESPIDNASEAKRGNTARCAEICAKAQKSAESVELLKNETKRNENLTEHNGNETEQNSVCTHYALREGRNAGNDDTNVDSNCGKEIKNSTRSQAQPDFARDVAGSNSATHLSAYNREAQKLKMKALERIGKPLRLDPKAENYLNDVKSLINLFNRILEYCDLHGIPPEQEFNALVRIAYKCGSARKPIAMLHSEANKRYIRAAQEGCKPREVQNEGNAQELVAC